MRAAQVCACSIALNTRQSRFVLRHAVARSKVFETAISLVSFLGFSADGGSRQRLPSFHFICAAAVSFFFFSFLDLQAPCKLRLVNPLGVISRSEFSANFRQAVTLGHICASNKADKANTSISPHCPPLYKHCIANILSYVRLKKKKKDKHILL